MVFLFMPRKLKQRLPVRNIVDRISLLDQWLYWANLKNNFLGSNFWVEIVSAASWKRVLDFESGKLSSVPSY